MTLRVLPLGCGDAFSARRYSFCLLLEHEDTRLLVDCPHPLRKMLVEGSARAGAPLDFPDIDGVLLTHLHADHCSGLESLAYLFRFGLQKRLPLLAHPDVSARLWEGALAAGMEQLKERGDDDGVRTRRLALADYFELVPLADEVTFGSLTLEVRPTVHHIPTTAVRARAGEARVGISADTAFDRPLLDWLLAADLVVHEVGHGPMHTSAESLRALPAHERARMRLVHYPDDLDLAAVGITPLAEGVPIVVEKRGRPGPNGTRPQ